MFNGLESLAERVGFEPTWGAMPPADFESEPFDRFGTSPITYSVGLKKSLTL